MAPPKKSIARKSSKKKPAKKKLKSTNGCLIITILLLTLVAISLGAAFYFLFLRPVPPVTPTPAPSAAPLTPPASAAAAVKQPPPAVREHSPAPALAQAPEAEAITPVPMPAPSPPRTTPRLAIIIDDFGNTKAIDEQFIALDLPLTFSILPHSPYGVPLAAQAKSRGRELLLHLPMEASDPKWSPAPGTLLLSMAEDELIATIDHDLDTTYRPVGINNHMGSRFTEDPAAMRVFLHAIKGRGMFFIDSLTSVNSVGLTLARELKIKTAKRDIFLDNDQDQTRILAQIGKAIALAQRHGSAIAIGHPYPATLQALRAARSRLKLDITMVPAHELVE